MENRARIDFKLANATRLVPNLWSLAPLLYFPAIAFSTSADFDGNAALSLISFPS